MTTGSVNSNHELQLLQQKAEQILQTGALASSARLHSLFQYLLRCSLAGYAPKEFEVAIDGMGQSASFDVNQDSLVRVHIHKLRRKLAEIQHQLGMESLLVLPKGEYRLVVLPAANASAKHVANTDPFTDKSIFAKESSANESKHDKPADLTLANSLERDIQASADILSTKESLSTKEILSRKESVARKGLCHQLLANWRVRSFLPWFLLLLSVSWHLSNTILSSPMLSAANKAPASANRLDLLLQPFASSATPVLLVLGDYYVFAEANEYGQVQRLVRQFDINSPIELLQSQQTDPQLAANQFDLGLSYLPTSAATALSQVASGLERQQIQFEVVLASQVNEAQLAHQAVIYLGQLSGLSELQTEWQRYARLTPNGSFDELRDKTSGRIYRNATPLSPPDTLPQYGYVHAWMHQDKPRLVLAGLRDEGLLAVGQYLQQKPLQNKNTSPAVSEFLFDSLQQQQIVVSRGEEKVGG